jgi:hypothetical protein
VSFTAYQASISFNGVLDMSAKIQDVYIMKANLTETKTRDSYRPWFYAHLALTVIAAVWMALLNGPLHTYDNALMRVVTVVVGFSLGSAIVFPFIGLRYLLVGRRLSDGLMCVADLGLCVVQIYSMLPAIQ